MTPPGCILCATWNALPFGGYSESEGVTIGEARAALVVGAYVALLRPTELRLSLCDRCRQTLTTMSAAAQRSPGQLFDVVRAARRLP